MSPSVLEPFIGPRPFDGRDASVFFGRERETQDLVSLVMAHRALLLYAPSGAGKSSLLNARVIPELVRPERGAKILGPGRVSGQLPEGLALESLANVFSFHLLVSLGIPTPVAARAEITACIEHLVQDHAAESDAPVVLVIDQFEELFTRQVDRWRDREPFLRALGAASDALPFLRIVLAMREEYLASLAPFVRCLPERIRAQYRLERLRRDAALEAIQRPVELAGRSFAPGAAQELLGNLLRVPVPGEPQKEIEGEFVEPVHLQVACRNVWDSLAPEQSVIELGVIRAAGSLDVALEEYYDACVATAAGHGSESEAHVREWIEAVLMTSEGTRNIVAKSPNVTAGMQTKVVEQLEMQHVLRAEIRGGAVFYELSHDRFLQPIRRSNRAWREKQLSQAPELAELEARAAAWVAGGRRVRKPSLLEFARRDAQLRLESAALMTAERLLASKAMHGLEPSAAVREYFEAHRDVHRVARQRLALTYLSVVSTVAVVLLSALLMIGVKYREARAAESSANDARAAAVEAQGMAFATAEDAYERFVVAEEQAKLLRDEKARVDEDLKKLRDEREKVTRDRDTLAHDMDEMRKQLESTQRALEDLRKQASTAQADLEQFTGQRNAADAAARESENAARKARESAQSAQDAYSHFAELRDQAKQTAESEERAALQRRRAAAEAIVRRTEEPGQALNALARGVELLADALRAGTPSDDVRAALAGAWRAVMIRTPLAAAGSTDVQLALDAKGAHALVWSRAQITLFDARTRHVLWRRAAPDSAAWSRVEFAPDGNSVLAVGIGALERDLAAQSAPGRAGPSFARIWSLSTRDGAELAGHELELGRSSIQGLDARNGRIVIAGASGASAFGLDGRMSLLDTSSEPPLACALSSDGQRVALRFGDSVRLTELGTGRRLSSTSFDAAREWLGVAQSLAFSADSKSFAACGFESPLFSADKWRVEVRATLDGGPLMRASVALDELTPGWIGFSDDGASLAVVGLVPGSARLTWRSIVFDVASSARRGSFDMSCVLLGPRPVGTSFLALDDARASTEVLAWNAFDGSQRATRMSLKSSTSRVWCDAALRTWIELVGNAAPELISVAADPRAPMDASALLGAARALLEGREEYAPVLAATAGL
ncbi:MAG: hypothetical protein IT454_20330 [Planctomycetes bacterium]|nr:hypothetical protein [Planctomycetota bacterium]